MVDGGDGIYDRAWLLGIATIVRRSSREIASLCIFWWEIPHIVSHRSIATDGFWKVRSKVGVGTIEKNDF